MIVLSLLLVLGSAAMLVVGLASATQILIWASIAASVGAAGALAAAVVRRRADPDQQMAAAVDAHTRALATGATETTTVVGDAGRHRAEQTGSRPEAAQRPVRPPDPPGEPPEEDVAASDVLRVIDLLDEVLVVDGRPRYHLPGCSSLIGRSTIPLPVSEARAAEFTPCAWCHPDRTLAAQSRNDSPGS